MITGIKHFLHLIKFSHTLFALPFALVGVILAWGEPARIAVNQPASYVVTWIIAAMVGARTGAMGLNRLVDTRWDALNPRTSMRPSVTGEVSPGLNIVMILLSYLLLIYAAFKLNPLAFYLSPVAIFLVSFYSYTKRFTSLAHIWLGFAIGAAPIAAWIAVTGEISIASLILGGSVLCWIAGFDVMYALQDRDFDQAVGLHSIPVRYGIVGSLRIARCLHIATFGLWLLLGRIADLGIGYLIGITLIGGLLLYEHRLVKADDLSKMDMAFFNMNAVISVTFFITVFTDVIILV